MSNFRVGVATKTDAFSLMADGKLSPEILSRKRNPMPEENGMSLKS